jgi:signal transduction histidine kinase
MNHRGATERSPFSPTSHLCPIARARRDHVRGGLLPPNRDPRSPSGAPRPRSVQPESLHLVAHDLRAPLSAILLQAASLARREAANVPGDARLKTGLEAIARNARRMERLIRDLLDLGRAAQGRFSVQTAGESLRTVLQEAHESARTIGGTRTIEVHVPAGDFELQVDRDRVLQVFANLIANAVRFTDARGRVTLGALVSPGANEFVTCWVDDDGVGMHPDHAAQAFEPFWQARHGDGGGLGVGLTICKEIVEAHGGRIGVEAGRGAGTRFWFTLPRVGAGVRTVAEERDRATP